MKNSNPTGIALYNFTADEIGECESLTKAVKTWAKALHAYRGERAYETFYS